MNDDGALIAINPSFFIHDAVKRK